MMEEPVMDEPAMDGQLGLRPYVTTVAEEWIDYNGHMTEGYYGVVFGDASDEVLTQLGFDEAYRNQQRGSFYTVETHVRFLAESNLGEPLEVTSLVVGVDPKRLHLFHAMAVPGEIPESAARAIATQESLLLHVDLDTVRVVPMGPSLLVRATTFAEANAASPVPEGIGRAIKPVRDTVGRAVRRPRGPVRGAGTEAGETAPR